jgi:hypothetical protein
MHTVEVKIHRIAYAWWVNTIVVHWLFVTIISMLARIYISMIGLSFCRCMYRCSSMLCVRPMMFLDRSLYLNISSHLILGGSINVSPNIRGSHFGGGSGWSAFSNSTKKERWMLHRKPLSYGEHLRAASWPTFVYGGSHCDWFDLRFFKWMHTVNIYDVKSQW